MLAKSNFSIFAELALKEKNGRSSNSIEFWTTLPKYDEII